MLQRPLPTERRLARSNDTLVSLCRLLDAARRGSELSAVALADASGCLVAGSGAARICDELAAVSTLAANDPLRNEINLHGKRPKVRQLRIDGFEVSICALGEAQEADYLRISDGCRRILREPATGQSAVP